MRGQHGDNDENKLLQGLGDVEDPVLFHRLADLDTLRGVRTTKNGVEVVVSSPVSNYPETAELERRLSTRAGVSVHVEFETLDEQAVTALGARLVALDDLPKGPQGPGGVRANPFADRSSSTRVLAIASGKGGVGKSTVTVNLAVALAAKGHAVGLLDADIYGFSVPRMLGIERPPIVLGTTIVPPAAHGVRSISMGFFVDEDKAVAWRGPMLHKALEQFLVDVRWGALDFLVVDMPPGTGDVALSVAQQLPRAELYVVTTPQPAAGRVAQRSAALARQVRVSIRGVIENMSGFVAPDGTRYDLFGTGGGGELAASLDVPLLAEIPFVPAVREGADDGMPALVIDPGGVATERFDELARRIVELGPARVYRSELQIS